MANYKSKVNFLQQHLEDLLTQKKALHSRVVTEEFHKFKLTSSRVSFVSNVLLSMLIVLISEYSLVNTVIISNSNSINCPIFFSLVLFKPTVLPDFQVISGDATAAEVRQTLTGLEKALKKEGLFKNVKSGFIHLKKEFLSVSIEKPAPITKLQKKFNKVFVFCYGFILEVKGSFSVYRVLAARRSVNRQRTPWQINQGALQPPSQRTPRKRGRPLTSISFVFCFQSTVRGVP